MHDLTSEQRLWHLNNSLHIGISKIVVILQDSPLGFGSMAPIRLVIKDYVQDLRELRACSPANPALFEKCIVSIFARHRGMIGQIARGLREFQLDILAGFEPFADLEPTDCAAAQDSVPGVRSIELALDEFFTIRTTLRLLIAHCIQLKPDAEVKEIGPMGFAMHELLARIPDSLREASADLETRHVGAVCLDTRPSLILIEAFRHCQYMFRQEFDCASKLMINGMPAKQFLSGEIHAFESLTGFDFTDAPDTARFPYVDIHLYFVFFEVLKNAMLTSIAKAGPDEKPPPIHVSILTGTSLSAENERTLKITDSGEGIHREDVRKVWSYFYSKVAEPVGESQRIHPLAGRGLGLAVSRVLVRYFGGEIDLHSIPRKGTDVYVYL